MGQVNNRERSQLIGFNDSIGADVGQQSRVLSDIRRQGPRAHSTVVDIPETKKELFEKFLKTEKTEKNHGKQNIVLQVELGASRMF